MKIAVLVGGIVYEVQNRLLEGIRKYADEENINIFVFTCNGDIYRQSEYGIGEFQILFLPDLTQYDGIIFARDTIQNEQFAAEITQRIVDSGTPVISIESHIPSMPVFYVDNREAMRDIVTHLIYTHGVSDLCYLSGPEQNLESVERLKGVMEAVKEYGLTLRKDWIHYGDFWVDSGKMLVEHLMKSGEKLPDALICANDDMAVGAYLEFCRHGVQVGKDILITGFDHTSNASDLTPKITTIEKPQGQIGYEACKALVEKKKIASRKFEGKCCYRGSCGCQEHKIRNLSEVQFMNVSHKLGAANMAEINKNMVSDLNDCDNMQELYECLKEYIEQLNFSFVYLCLCEDSVSEDTSEADYQIKEGYSEKISLPGA